MRTQKRSTFLRLSSIWRGSSPSSCVVSKYVKSSWWLHQQRLLVPHELNTKGERVAERGLLSTEPGPEEYIYCISKSNDNMSKACSPLLLKVLSLLPQNYTHLTLLKSALSKDEREGRPKAPCTANTLQRVGLAREKKKGAIFFLIYCSLYCKCAAFFNHPP